MKVLERLNYEGGDGTFDMLTKFNEIGNLAARAVSNKLAAASNLRAFCMLPVQSHGGSKLDQCSSLTEASVIT